MRLSERTGEVTLTVHCRCGGWFHDNASRYEDWLGRHRGHGGFSNRAYAETAVPDANDITQQRPLRPGPTHAQQQQGTP